MTKTIDALVEALQRLHEACVKDGWPVYGTNPHAMEVARAALAQARAEQAEPFGIVTIVRRPGHEDAHFFYPHPQPPYLDNAAECHTVYTTPPAAPVAKLEPQGVTDEMVTRAARMLCRIHAGECQVNEDDTWLIYCDQFKRDARAALEAAHNAKLGGAR